MVSFSPIWAIVLRQALTWRRDPNVILAAFYWPLLDILVWGFLASWVGQSSDTQFNNYEAAILLGILLWQVVGRGGNIIANSLNEELWSNNNVVNLFSLPLRTIEWICGTILFYLIMTCITVFFCMLITPVLYNMSLWYMLSTFLIFAPPLFFCGIWVGFTCLQIVVTLGKRSIELGYILIWFLLPFCGVYYPVEILPGWGQKISAFLPMSYVFQGMRNYVMHQQDPTSYLIKGYALSILYAVSAIILFVYCFNRSKHQGLARLSD